MNINLSISQAPGIATNYLVSAIYEANADGSIGPLAAFQAFAAPHTSARNISYTNVDPIVYVHILYENIIGQPGGTLRNRFIYDPSYNNSTINLRVDLFLTVGAGAGNPVSGETSFLRADLATWGYSIEKRGVGTMKEGVEVAINPIGGFTLLQSGDAFYTGDIWVLRFTPRVVTNNPIEPQTPGKLFSASDIITSNATLIASDIGKSKLIQSATDNITVTLMALSLIGANRLIGFVSDGGSHKNAVLLASGTDKIQFKGKMIDRIILGQNEMVYMYKGTNAGGDAIWIVSMCKGAFDEVGQIFMSFNLYELNAVPAIGQLLDRIVYPRLWEAVKNLSADVIVTDANWLNAALNNKGRFSTGNGTSTFRVPDLSIPGFIRGVNGVDRNSGSYEAPMLLDHQHVTPSVGGDNPGDGLVAYGKATSLASIFSAWFRTATTAFRDLVSKPTNSTGAYLTTGNQNSPSNTGIYFLIKS